MYLFKSTVLPDEYFFQFEVLATLQRGYTGDIAIDNMEVLHGVCAKADAVSFIFL